MPTRRILIVADAPPKPPAGQPCNGCGVCCAAEPCPLGVAISRRRDGACAALLWSDAERRYRCGAIADPRRFVPWLPAGWTRRLARRWVAAGAGCDADYETEAG